MDEDRCLNCTCTFSTGCREERRTNATLKTLLERRRRPIPPQKLTAPPSHHNRDTEKQREYARANYERHIARFGGTVRERK